MNNHDRLSTQQIYLWNFNKYEFGRILFLGRKIKTKKDLFINLELI